MKKERLKVLEMIESGKINVEEATKLLEALKGSSEYEWDPTDYDDAEEKLNQFSQSVDSFAKEFGDKVNSTFKEMEPKLRSAAKVVVEKTITVVDDLAKVLGDTAKNLDNKEAKSDCCCSSAQACEPEPTCEENKEECKDSCCDNEPKQN